jgi:hypothetical protein
MAKRFVVFTWAHWLIYMAGLLSGLWASVRLITYPTPEYSTWEKLPSLLLPLTWGFAGAMLYHYRSAWAGKLVWTTRQGVAVWAEWATRQWLLPREVKIERTLAEVIAWWTSYYVSKGHLEAGRAISGWFDGSNLEVALTEEGVGDARHGIRAKAGLAYPKRLVLQLKPSEMAGSDEGFMFHVGHEAGHECLLAMGVANDNQVQHEFMREAGFPYA